MPDNFEHIDNIRLVSKGEIDLWHEESFAKAARPAMEAARAHLRKNSAIPQALEEALLSAEFACRTSKGCPAPLAQWDYAGQHLPVPRGVDPVALARSCLERFAIERAFAFWVAGDQLQFYYVTP